MCLTRDRTHSLGTWGRCSNPLSHTSQGTCRASSQGETCLSSSERRIRLAWCKAPGSPPCHRKLGETGHLSGETVPHSGLGRWRPHGVSSLATLSSCFLKTAMTGEAPWDSGSLGGGGAAGGGKVGA
uniref:Uncharacterized protein n=1 Tax=Myotis myotis TaxID=51298 RepID=A0A7J7QXP7_MYOMY|nr:hypothetical protein mMyoMyo1_011274 [Myotis myotis]